MTNQNYTQLSNKQLLDEIKQLNVGIKQLSKYLIRHKPDLMKQIIDKTLFLDKHKTNITITERLFCIENNLNSIPTCKVYCCTNFVKWDRASQSYRTYCCNACAQKDELTKVKRADTCNNKYGVKSPLQREDVKIKLKSTIVKNKIKNTMIQKYGVENALQSDEIHTKQKQTMIQKYGIEYASQSQQILDKRKQTCNDRFGCNCVFQNADIKEKIHETNLSRYGVRHFTQSEQYKKHISEYFSLARRLYTNDKYPGMTFASSWEFKVYDFLTEHHIEFKYQDIEPIPYEYDGIQHLYFPDFKLTSNGQLIEVKGDHFFRINESTGKEEMFKPFKNKDWSDERYEYECQKYEEKHQCMIKNNVIILREKQIKNLQLSMFT